jgi:hypothetical protein
LELSPISPDNTKFAYTTPLYEVLDEAYEDRRSELANLRPRELFIVDIVSAKITPITDYAAHFAEAVKSDKIVNISDLTWSVDGKRLYFLSSVLSARNRVPQKSIEYYDLASNETRIMVKLNSQVDVVGLYAMAEGLLLLDGAQNQGQYAFTLYDTNGEIINSTDMELMGAQDCTNGLMFGMNPVVSSDDYFYGFYAFQPEPYLESPSLLDVASNTETVVEGEAFPALMSHANPDESLRLVFEGSCDYDEAELWKVTDPQGNHIESTYILLDGNRDLFELTLSPDGQTVAMLNPKGDFYDPDPIIIMDANSRRELNFAANQILWGATDFTFSSVKYRG